VQVIMPLTPWVGVIPVAGAAGAGYEKPPPANRADGGEQAWFTELPLRHGRKDIASYDD
jgi:uncharacterized membrane protein